MNGDFSIHSDMKSRIRGGLTLEKVKAYATSTRQKIIFYISTEADLVGMDNIMPQLFWTHYFMEAQGLKNYDNMVYQDNYSLMLIEKGH